MSQICQSQLSILPNMKWTVKILPKTGKIFPKWRNNAKSGHTAHKLFSLFSFDLFSFGQEPRHLVNLVTRQWDKI